jgi:hypothetical protein
MTAKCPSCGSTQNLGTRVLGKLAMPAVVAVFGRNAFKRHAITMVLLELGALAFGHYLDTNVLPNCPTCQVAMEVVELIA